MTASYQVRLDVDVYALDDLREAAKAKAIESMTAEAWAELRSENFSAVAADLHMLLDPGASPPGCSITNSEVEFVDGDPADE